MSWKKLTEPEFMIRVHAVHMYFWIFMAVPSVIFWSTSTAFIVYISVWALVYSSFAAWQAGHAELRVKKEQEDERN